MTNKETNAIEAKDIKVNTARVMAHTAVGIFKNASVSGAITGAGIGLVPAVFVAELAENTTSFLHIGTAILGLAGGSAGGAAGFIGGLAASLPLAIVKPIVDARTRNVADPELAASSINKLNNYSISMQEKLDNIEKKMNTLRTSGVNYGPSERGVDMLNLQAEVNNCVEGVNSVVEDVKSVFKTHQPKSNSSKALQKVLDSSRGDLLKMYKLSEGDSRLIKFAALVGYMNDSKNYGKAIHEALVGKIDSMELKVSGLTSADNTAPRMR